MSPQNIYSTVKITKLLGLSFFQQQCQLKQLPLSAPSFVSFLTWKDSLEWFTPWEEAEVDFIWYSDNYKWQSISRFRYPSRSEHPTFMTHFLPWDPDTHPNQFFLQKPNFCPELCGSDQNHLICCCTPKSMKTYKPPLRRPFVLEPQENQFICRWLTKDPLWGWVGNWVPSAVPDLAVICQLSVITGSPQN